MENNQSSFSFDLSCVVGIGLTRKTQVMEALLPQVEAALLRGASHKEVQEQLRLIGVHLTESHYWNVLARVRRKAKRRTEPLHTNTHAAAVMTRVKPDEKSNAAQNSAALIRRKEEVTPKITSNSETKKFNWEEYRNKDIQF